MTISPADDRGRQTPAACPCPAPARNARAQGPHVVRSAGDEPGDRPPVGPAPAVQVRGAVARLVLRHGRPGSRLLRALPPLLRQRPAGIPPPPGTPGVLARLARVRD